MRPQLRHLILLAVGRVEHPQIPGNRDPAIERHCQLEWDAETVFAMGLQP
jgi:hypothetical protein